MNKNKENLLLDQLTQKEFGYSVFDLTKGSQKKIYHKCIVCDEPKTNTCERFWKGRAVSHVECKVEKAKKTNLHKYGVDNPFKNEEIQKRQKETCIEKYGVSNVRKSDIVKQKIRQTKRQNSGYEYYTIYEVKGKDDWLNQTFHDGCKINANQDLPDKWSQGSSQQFEIICTCGTIWSPIFSNFTSGKSKTCGHGCSTSQGEQQILNYIEDFGVECLHRYRIDNTEFDIYIPSKQIAIEYNGLFYHSELQGRDRKYHLSKTKLAESNNIHLIHIFEDEWLNKQDIVKSKLRHLLGLGTETLYARKCIIQQIDSKTKSQFLNQHHIQGKDSSSIKLGAYYQDQLVAVMTFGKRRKALGAKHQDNHYELIRFATSNHVVGIASKLLKYFIRNYNPKLIISYADRRWTYSERNLYQKIGFNQVGFTEPNYWYINPKKTCIERIHRFNFRKDILKERLEQFDPNLTEWQNMINNGYDRVWDCGSIKYQMNQIDEPNYRLLLS